MVNSAFWHRTWLNSEIFPSALSLSWLAVFYFFILRVFLPTCPQAIVPKQLD